MPHDKGILQLSPKREGFLGEGIRRVGGLADHEIRHQREQFAQDRARTDAMAVRVSERIKTLQAEADRLAAQSRTLLGDLRQLEIERDIANEKVKAADTAVAEAQASVQHTTDTIAALEQQRAAQLPDLKLRLVDIYKRGRSGYAQLLFDARGIRELARAMRAAAALTTINNQKIEEIITTFVSRSLASFTCIKKRMTSVALKEAIANATTVLNGPRSRYATPAVTKVRTISAPQIT